MSLHDCQKSMECTKLKVNPNVNCALQLIMMHQYWLIDYNEWLMFTQGFVNKYLGEDILKFKKIYVPSSLPHRIGND